MSIFEKNISVTMIRTDFEDLHVYNLPADFSIRWFEADDVDEWVKLYSSADEFNTITTELFHREFGNDSRLWHDRICFILDEDQRYIATAAAWYDNDFQGQCWGRIHWVAILPEMQGRGFAKPLMSIICSKLKELGHEKVYLATSTARVPAINLYWKFGFVPDVSTSEKQSVWESFMRETGMQFLT